jgi:hypothetical protein
MKATSRGCDHFDAAKKKGGTIVPPSIPVFVCANARMLMAPEPLGLVAQQALRRPLSAV